MISSLYLKIIVFKLIVFLSKHLRVFVGNLQQSSEIVWERLSGLGNNFGKSSENCQKRCHQYTCNYVLVEKSIPHLFTALTREILFLSLERKIHIILLATV